MGCAAAKICRGAAEIMQGYGSREKEEPGT